MEQKPSSHWAHLCGGIVLIYSLLASSPRSTVQSKVESTTAITSQGDISSVFGSMTGETYTWPSHYADLKAKLRPPSATLMSAWKRLNASLEMELSMIEHEKQNIIPSVPFRSVIGDVMMGFKKGGPRFSTLVAERVRKRGVVIVRGVVSRTEAEGWRAGISSYRRANPNHTGFPPPPADPQVLELYWSKAQIQARQHPHVHAVLLALNRLYDVAPTGLGASFEHPLTYGERLRIRQPGDTSFQLGPHMDGGSVERFEDEAYQRTYQAVFNGSWEGYNPFGAHETLSRTLADVSRHRGNRSNGQATVTRTFQGWLALSPTAGGENSGSLRVLPLLRETTAYVLLRPFLNDVPPATFCGAIPGKSQDVVNQWHAPLLRGMTSLPALEPGDMVFWHPDIVHAVDAEHHGKVDSTVFYIPAMPATLRNARYVAAQRLSFRDGRTPPDFPPNDSEVHFQRRATFSDLTPLGRVMFGVDALRPDPSRSIVPAAMLARHKNDVALLNKALGFGANMVSFID